MIGLSAVTTTFTPSQGLKRLSAAQRLRHKQVTTTFTPSQGLKQTRVPSRPRSSAVTTTFTPSQGLKLEARCSLMNQTRSQRHLLPLRD